MTKRLLSAGALALLMTAAGCAHASRTTSAGGLTPNYGGDNIDQSSAQYNTDPAVANYEEPPKAASATGTGSSQQQQ